MIPNIIGKQFGRWTVLSKTTRKTKSNNLYYLCQCQCGTIREVLRFTLTSGKSISCGCYQKELASKKNLKDLMGQQFGEWIVIGRGKRKSKSGSVYWLCKCNCGTVREILTSGLTRGISKSCGCLGADHSKEYGYAAKNVVYTQYKDNAKKRNLPFELSFEQFISMTQEKCYYCGIEPSNFQKNKFNNGSFTYNGIDRLDNTKGYTIENCVPCHKICNYMKRNLSCEDFSRQILRISENLEKRQLGCEY